MKNKKITLIVRRIILAIISIAIGFGIYTWNAERLTGNKMPMPFGFGMGMVLTGSMEPEIGVNDLIFVVFIITLVVKIKADTDRLSAVTAEEKPE